MHERIMKPGRYSYEFDGECWVLTYIQNNQWKTEHCRHKATVLILLRRKGLE